MQSLAKRVLGSMKVTRVVSGEKQFYLIYSRDKRITKVTREEYESRSRMKFP